MPSQMKVAAAGQNRDMAAVQVAGGGDQRDQSPSQDALQFGQRRCALRRLEFCDVACGEFVEPCGLVRVPLAKFGRRRDLR